MIMIAKNTEIDTEAAIVEAVVVETKKPIEPVFYNGIFPVFLLEDNNTLAEIQAQRYPCSFILGRIEEKGEKPGTSTYRDALFQMMDGPISYGLSEVPFDRLGISANLKERAHLKTPKMPWNFVALMDAFFRAAFEKYGTESIVMLTYDMDKMGTDDAAAGWDFYVPTQTNTAHDCNYEKSEVLDELEGTSKILAGSAHSHPEMGAFFSSTDHDDQVDWPGIHITFAWDKGSDVSSHHIELIQNNKQWTYEDISMIFESPPKPKIETDFDLILEQKVSEKKPTVTTLGYGQHGYGAGRTPPFTGSRSISHTGPNIQAPHIFMPENTPDVRENVIVAVVTKEANACRFCTAPVTDKMRDVSSCYACSGLFMMESEDLDTLTSLRNTRNLDVSMLNGKKPVWAWKVNTNSKGFSEHEFELIGGETTGPKG